MTTARKERKASLVYREEVAARRGSWTPPTALKAGPQMEALRRFHFDCTWTGYVWEGGMGPDSPQMTAVGRATFKPIMEGLWLAGDFEQDQFVKSELAIRWMAHYVVGWDPAAGEYKVAFVDNNGGATVMHGHIDGNRFIVETGGDGPLKLMLTWEIDVSGQVKWRNERSFNDGPWFLVEEYVCIPVETSGRPGNGPETAHLPDENKHWAPERRIP